VREAIIRLGQLAVDFPELAEIEINPLRALPQGAYALDARARLV
jgi:succinyl-CoA synthetase beta subunit